MKLLYKYIVFTAFHFFHFLEGGIYGFARVQLGPLPGFVVGTLDCIVYILFSAYALRFFSFIFEEVFSLPAQYAPLYWLGFYIFFTCIFLFRQRGFYVSTKRVGTVSVVLLLIYFIGAAPHMNSEHFWGNVASAPLYSGGIGDMFNSLTVAAWFFQGIEAIPLLSDEIVEVNCLSRDICW
jgi:ethanolamine permease